MEALQGCEKPAMSGLTLFSICLYPIPFDLSLTDVIYDILWLPRDAFVVVAVITFSEVFVGTVRGLCEVYLPCCVPYVRTVVMISLRPFCFLVFVNVFSRTAYVAFLILSFLGISLDSKEAIYIYCAVIAHFLSTE